jgi:hypothetical protein
MNRRDTIKSLLLGSVAAGLTLKGCTTSNTSSAETNKVELPVYGRTEKEKERDQQLMAETFLNEHELATIAVLCDIILPANDNVGAATAAGVDKFIDFIVKDLPSHQIPIRGGLMWLDNFSNKTYGKEFIDCTEKEQLQLCDQIAYPKKTKPELKQGEKFFANMRNLTLTGYYTSKMGIDDLGYKGNTPNVWDGVPQEVLKAHHLEYDKEWLAKCIDQSTRDVIATWDEKGNLLT